MSPVNDPPVAVPDTVSTSEDTPVTIAVLGNDSDIDGNPLSVIAASSPDGTVVINPDGTLTFVPNDDFTGAATITYTISDGAGGTATTTATVLVSPVNDAPLAVADTATTSEDVPVKVAVLANDSDVDGDPLTVTAATSPDGSVTINADGTITFTPNANFNGVATVSYSISDGQGGTATSTVTITVAPVNDPPVASPSSATTAEDTPVIVQVLANDTDIDGNPLTVTAASALNGTVAILADGTVRYTPNPDFNGVDTITYSISDGQGGFATSTVSVTVTAVNDVPVATNDAASTGEDQPVTIPVLANDSDRDGDPLTVTAASSPNGTVTINPDGTLTFLPNPNFNGPATITYTISDGNGGTATATVAVTVVPVNDAPVANPSSATTPEDSPVVLAVLANDTDVDGDPLTVVSATAANGTVTINPDGTVTYTPAANFNGVDTVTYTISDENGGFATSTVSVTVTPVNDPPIAVNDTATTPEDTPVTLPVLLNDSDLDGDSLTVTVAGSPHGTVTINPDGTLTFVPAANFNGPATITYTIGDGKGGTATASVLVTVTPVNDAPAAVPDAATTREDTPVGIAILPNDSDVDGDTLTVVRAVAGNGTVSINPDGTLNYVPAANFNGVDTITYTISDGNGGFATTTVTVTVTPVNDPPVANPSTSVTPEDTAVILPVLANDTDLDGNLLTVTAASAVNGAVTILPDGTVRYVPNPNFNGTDTVTYTISDGNGGTATSTVTVTVTTVNDPPVDGDEAIETNPGVINTIPVLANATDVEGDQVSVFSATVDVGTVTINNDGTLSYVAPFGFQGIATITYVVADGRGGFDTSTVTVRVRVTSADMNALLGLYQQPVRPETWLVDSIRDQTREFISVPLIVTDTVNSFRSLRGTPDLGEDRPLLTAVNGISWLGGIADFGRDPMHPVNDTIRYLDRVRDLRDEVDRLFDPRWSDFTLETLTGFSVRQLSTGSDQVMIDSVVRDRVIYMEIKDIGPDDASRIVEFQLRTRDGAPLPDWTRMDARGLAIIERPVDAEEIRLVVRAIRADGSIIEIPVVIQGSTGEIQLDAPLSANRSASAETLAETLLAARTAAHREAAMLASAFSA